MDARDNEGKKAETLRAVSANQTDGQADCRGWQLASKTEMEFKYSLLMFILDCLHWLLCK